MMQCCGSQLYDDAFINVITVAVTSVVVVVSSSSRRRRGRTQALLTLALSADSSGAFAVADGIRSGGAVASAEFNSCIN